MLLLEVHDVSVCVCVFYRFVIYIFCFFAFCFLLFVVCRLSFVLFFPFGINLYVNELLFDCSMLAALSSSYAQNL